MTCASGLLTAVGFMAQIRRETWVSGVVAAEGTVAPNGRELGPGGAGEAADPVLASAEERPKGR